MNSGYELAIGFVQNGRVGSQLNTMSDILGAGDGTKFPTDIASVKLMHVYTN
jgi:hypothetical protein